MFDNETGGVLLGAVIALMGSFGATWLALRGERQNRWLERKTEAYITIIDALYDIIDYYDLVMDEELNRQELPKERKKEIELRQREAHSKVKKAALGGQFLISNEAKAALEHFRKEPNETAGQIYVSMSWFEHADITLSLAKKCLSEITDIAKKDLKVS